MTAPCVAAALSIATVQAVPLQLPRLRPIKIVLFGARVVSVAVIGPPVTVANGWFTAPLMFRVPEKVLVVSTGVVGTVGTELESDPHAAMPLATASTTISLQTTSRGMQ